MTAVPKFTRPQQRGSSLVWLAYTLFFFVEPFLRPTPKIWIATIVTIAAFVPVFLTYVRTGNETTRRLMILITFAIALISYPWNTGASTFFIYAAVFLPFSFASVPLVLSLFAVESLAVFAESWVFHLPWQNAAFTTFLLTVIGGGNIYFAQQRRADCKLRMAQDEIEALAAVAERERIARDLHDVLGHTLSVIALKAELAGRLLDAGSEASIERARAEIRDVERTSRTALAEVHEAIGGYRTKGLLAEFEEARRTLEVAGVTLDSNAVGEKATDLSASEETMFALALREAVTNIVRHARATTCRLQFATENGCRRLIVEDDGRHSAVQEGNGLRGMRERVEALGGLMQLDRKSGTRLLIELPSSTQRTTS